LLTLIVVPVLYSYLDDLAHWARRRLGAGAHESKAPTAGGSIGEHMPASKD
jgi:HAE1 family hydrophobic/amphiphilic exporter-1